MISSQLHALRAKGCAGLRGGEGVDGEEEEGKGEQWSMLLVGMRPVWIVQSMHEASVDSIQCAIRPV